MRIVVIGGTGLVGSKVVHILTTRGHDAVAAAPSTGVDAVTGEGLARVLVSASVVIDVSNSPPFGESAAVEFFTASTLNQLAAEAEAGVDHHVVLSVVGTDRLAPHNDYFRAKLLQESMVDEGGIPYSIVRVTQFFEFLRAIADSATVGATVRLPSAQIRPMAAVDVADAVVAVALGPPVNGVTEVGGPEPFRLPELIQTALTARGDVRQVVVDPAARYWGVGIEERTLLPEDGAMISEIRFEDWIIETAARS